MPKSKPGYKHNNNLHKKKPIEKHKEIVPKEKVEQINENYFKPKEEDIDWVMVVAEHISGGKSK